MLTASATRTRRPIVVTGCPRSGTTWVGKTIAAHPDVFHLYEPFNNGAPHALPGIQRFSYQPAVGYDSDPRVAGMMALGSLSTRLLMSARAGLRGKQMRSDWADFMALRELVKNTSRFLTARRVCVKDPLAFFLSEWLASEFDASVLMLVRHPAGVISSYLKLGWKSELAPIVQNERLLERFAGSLQEELKAYQQNPDDLLGSLILQWKLFTTATLELKAQHPNWLLARHEDICARPLERFRAIFDALGLRWSESIAEQIRRDTDDSNPVDPSAHKQHVLQRRSSELAFAWKSRLDAHERARVEEETRALWKQVQSIASKDSVSDVPREREEDESPSLGSVELARQ